MITGGLMIISPDAYDEEMCLDPAMEWAGYGSRWVDMGDGNSYVSRQHWSRRLSEVSLTGHCLGTVHANVSQTEARHLGRA